MIRIFSQYVSPRCILLALWEGLLIAFCMAAAAKLRFWRDPIGFDVFTTWPEFGLQVLVSVAVFLVCFYYNELYDLTVIRRRSDQMLRLWQALGAACMVLGFLYFLIPDIQIGRGVFFISVVLLATATSLSRVTLDLAWRWATPKQNVLILGAGPLAVTVAREFVRRSDLNLALAGMVDTNPTDGGHPEAMFTFPVLGHVSALHQIVADHHIASIIVALEDRRGTLPTRSLVNLRVRGIPVEDAHTTLASLTGRVWLNTVRPSWFVYSDGFRRSTLTLILKRALDLCFGICGLLLCSPLMAIIAAAVRLDSRGPAIYKQLRVGLSGRLFNVLKFRSMVTNAETATGAQWATVDDPRVTRLGKYLRKYRLDELPQFLNVIRGDMSFIGPRPERPEFVEQLREAIPYYDERHSVRPGLTGWAQVQYSYAGTLDDSSRKLEYDLFYLKNMSIPFDFAIMVQTVRIVLFGWGAR